MDTKTELDQAKGLHRQGNLAMAEKAYLRILEADPTCCGAYLLLGALRSQQGRIAEASLLIGKALQISPDDFEALSLHGPLLMAEGRFEEALASTDQLLAIAPGNAVAWNSRGVALRALARPEGALEAFERAVMLEPDFADALRNRGRALREARRLDAALASYDRAIARDPGNAATWNERGMLLGEMNRPGEALASYDKAITLKPDHVDALIDRGCLQWSKLGRRYDDATKDLERALALALRHAYARGELLHIRMQAADWRDFPREKAQIDRDIGEGRLAIQPFVYQAISNSAADLAACSRLFARLYPAVPGPQIPPSRNHGKIRIGYLSADFREQATAYLAVGLYEMHDRQTFEIIAFDNGGGDGSAVRARLEKAFDKIVDISQMADDAAANRIRAEEIDILVNLNGYFGANRMGVFAHKPAPVQVNFLGFPGTLGAGYIDYILADRVVIPEEERCHYSEQVVYLPDCYQVNDSRRPIGEDSPTRAGCGLPEKAFIFCNFNQSYKFTPAMFEAWMRILGQIPDSVFWLLDDIAEFRDNLRRAAEGHGVAGTRLIFAPRVAVEQHLARLRLADLFLDSLPYNAHTTASDALWAGLPLVTCRGTTFPGRVAASLLGAAGLPDLVTQTPDDYERLAVALARDPARLGAIRQRLQQNRLACALFDTNRFRRHIEASYATMWDSWLRGEKPHGFSVAPVPA